MNQDSRIDRIHADDFLDARIGAPNREAFLSEPQTFDVEMEGKTGHTCHIYVIADSDQDAEAVAQDQFPELNLTGNTRIA